jgi:hypothetical protein
MPDEELARTIMQISQDVLGQNESMSPSKGSKYVPVCECVFVSLCILQPIFAFGDAGMD